MIRDATHLDIPLLRNFQIKMAKETENVDLDKKVVDQGISILMDEPSKGKYFIAEEKGVPVGCLMITYEWSDWRCSTIIWVQSVYVIESFRGKGVFKSLYEFIKNKVAVDPELTGIRLYVDKSNHHAQQVYKKLGMNDDHYFIYEWMKEK